MRSLVVFVALLPTASTAQTFENVAPELGISGANIAAKVSVGIGCGVSWADVDGNGQQDLIMVGANITPKLYKQSDGGFTVDEDTLIPDTAPGNPNGHIVFDMDNDGDPDVLLLRRAANALMRNDGGKFIDVSTTHLPGNALWAVSAAAGDFDADGDTDIYVGHYISNVAFPAHDCAPNIILENDGHGRFTANTPTTVGLKRGCTLATAMSDYDNDGDLDLISINDFGQYNTPNELYRNDGIQPDGTWSFTDVSEKSGFNIGLYGMGVSSADLNGDGWMDYFITNIGRPVVLLGSEKGTFTDATAEFGADIRYADTGWQVTWGSVIEDLNGDGWLDVFAAGGHVEATDYLSNQLVMPNLLLVGSEADKWQDGPKSWSIPLLNQNSARSVAAEDYDKDGRVDLAVAQMNGLLALYKNTSSSPPTLSISLKPGITGPDAAGTHITATCMDQSRKISLMAGGAYGGTSSKTIRITFPAPCNKTGQTVKALIRWPGGYVQKATFRTGDQVELEEPQWLELTHENVYVKLTNENGDPLSKDATVVFTAPDATFSNTTAHGGGAFSATVVPENDAKDTPLSISVNGKVMTAHPKISWPKLKSNLLRTSPQHIISGQGYQIFVTLYGADGVPLEGDQLVTVKVGNDVLAANYLGSGKYIATGEPLPAGPIELQPTKLGQNYGDAVLKVVKPPFDLKLSTVRVQRLPRLATPPEDVAPEPVLVFMTLRDANGVGVEPSGDKFEAKINGQVVEPQNVLNDGLEMLIAYAPSKLTAGSSVTFFYDGIQLTPPQKVHVFDAPKQLATIVDAEKSYCATSMLNIVANGADVTILVIFLKDAAGNPIPNLGATPTLSSKNLTLVPDSIEHIDDRWEMKVQSGDKPGIGQINVLLGGQDLGIQCEVELAKPGPAPEALDPELSFVEIKPDIIPAEGLATAVARAFPRLPSGRLAGSGLAVEMKSTLGTFVGETQYITAGRYEATLVPKGEAGIATITATVKSPPLTMSTEATFFSVNEIKPDSPDNPEPADTPDKETLNAENTDTPDTTEPSDHTTSISSDAANAVESEDAVITEQSSASPDGVPTAQNKENSSGGCSNASGDPGAQSLLLLLLLLVTLRRCEDRRHA